MIAIAPPNGFETNTGTFRKGKAGRPPQAGERYPSGKLKPVDKREGGPAPTEIKRTFEAGLRRAADPLHGTSLGLLFVSRAITAPQLSAAIAYARLRGRYDRAMGMPGRFTMSPDYGTARAISNKQPIDDDEVEAIKARQAKTFAAIDAAMEGAWCEKHKRSSGDGAYVWEFRWISPERELARRRYEAERTVSVLERVCVEDLACESYELDRLRTALQLLVPWFGISS